MEIIKKIVRMIKGSERMIKGSVWMIKESEWMIKGSELMIKESEWMIIDQGELCCQITLETIDQYLLFVLSRVKVIYSYQ